MTDKQQCCYDLEPRVIEGMVKTIHREVTARHKVLFHDGRTGNGMRASALPCGGLFNCHLYLDDQMNFKLSHLIGCACLVATLLVGVSISLAKNEGGYSIVRTCIQSSGGHVDPRSGDGPECFKYENVRVKESMLRTFTRGLGEAMVPALVFGFIGLLAGEYLDKKKSD